MAALNGLTKLKILSLGRNQIKKLEALDGVADTLQELWISYNLLEKLVSLLAKLCVDSNHDGPSICTLINLHQVHWTFHMMMCSALKTDPLGCCRQALKS